MVHVNVAKNGADDVGTNLLASEAAKKRYLRVLLDEYLDTLLLRLGEVILLHNKLLPSPLPELPRFP